MYRITIQDTIVQDSVNVLDGYKNFELIYPPPIKKSFTRTLISKDSIVIREYPDFIRLGLFESVGIGSASTSFSMNGNAGVFGIFSLFDPNSAFSMQPGQSNLNNHKIFPGGMYRIGILEKKSFWFENLPNMAIGTSLVEYVNYDTTVSGNFLGFFPIYLKNRIFLNNALPYITICPSFGFSYFKDQYINASVSIEAGSVGGFNLRAYVGYLSSLSDKRELPYIGIGASFLDFVNRDDELVQEWKYYKQRSWEIGLINVLALSTQSDTSFITNLRSNSPFKGMIGRFLPTSISLSFINDNISFETSLMNLVILGNQKGGLGILPLRIGYWQKLLSNGIFLEPFFEYNYYPSTMVHIGTRLSLHISQMLNLQFQAGMINIMSNIDLSKQLNFYNKFNSIYIGVGIGFLDKIQSISSF
ncbi:MAG: hypothetical protein ACKO5I_04000 [Ignavibacteria bacterium]